MYRSKKCLLYTTSVKVNWVDCYFEKVLNHFCSMVDPQKAFSLISSQEHCQRLSPSRIFDRCRKYAVSFTFTEINTEFLSAS